MLKITNCLFKVRIYSAADIPPDSETQAISPQPTFSENVAPGQIHETVKTQVVVEPMGDFPQKPVFIQLPPSQFIQLSEGQPLKLEVSYYKI